jgi:hypothetical protein
VQIDSSGSFTESDSTVTDARSIDMTFSKGTLEGKTVYQIYRVDGDKLYLGDGSGVPFPLTSDKRPTALETTPYAKR